ncbi:MAG: haloacid dehalogenase-like hydrolase [SAR324 cluster bacterium]|uniref:Haloacid dehalogenase-like hydrolase n=1 Tax=SAR324 cluster bacterium TaxID=2024889 RepID=A0A7X9IIS8_9DELT|nr:haloacid dehalogenase-like hydrolase [SAR324 cluster bacterium]
MKLSSFVHVLGLTLFSYLLLNSLAFGQEEALPSWNSSNTKTAILEYIKDISNTSSPNHIKVEDRIAVFDNDGTLMLEAPQTAESEFTNDYYANWIGKKSDTSFLQGLKRLFSRPSKEESTIGLSLEAYHEAVNRWQKTYKHPRFQRSYSHLVYKPMLELLSLLKENSFTSYISTGSEREFIRGFADTAYGLSPDRIIGSDRQYTYCFSEEGSFLLRQFREPHLNLNEFKAINIQKHIGKRPIFVVGNTDGDIQMLEYSQSSPLPSIQILIRHDDPVKEYSYINGAERVFSLAEKRGWKIVSIQRDWKDVF